MITQSQAIADLQAKWHLLKDLDRADAVSTIHKSGVSLRGLARALNCSESLLRHLLHARTASPEDLVLARRGQISTWEARSKVQGKTCLPSLNAAEGRRHGIRVVGARRQRLRNDPALAL